MGRVLEFRGSAMGASVEEVCDLVKENCEDEIVVVGFRKDGSVSVYTSRPADATPRTIYQTVGQLEDAKQFLLHQLDVMYGG